MASVLRWWLSPVCALAFVACAKDDQPNLPTPPVSGGSGIHDTNNGTSSSGVKDAGPDAWVDAGDAAVPASSCERVVAMGDTTGDAIVATAISTPTDFMVTRQAEVWSNDCTDPKLTLELSDGVCPDGFGHQLTITFDLNDIADGAIHVGNNAVYAETESSSIDVHYVRPDTLDPYGSWGSCNGASGQVVFDMPPDPTAGAIFNARFDLDLTPCGDVSTPVVETVSGAFRIELRYQLSEFCPTSM